MTIQERVWEWRWEGHPLVWALVPGILGVLILAAVIWILASLAPVLLAVVAAVLGIRWLTRAGRRPGEDPALAILRERYARGEIGREEYEARRRDLES